MVFVRHVGSRALLVTGTMGTTTTGTNGRRRPKPLIVLGTLSNTQDAFPICGTVRDVLTDSCNRSGVKEQRVQNTVIEDWGMTLWGISHRLLTGICYRKHFIVSSTVQSVDSRDCGTVQSTGATRESSTVRCRTLFPSQRRTVVKGSRGAQL